MKRVASNQLNQPINGRFFLPSVIFYGNPIEQVCGVTLPMFEFYREQLQHKHSDSNTSKSKDTVEL